MRNINHAKNPMSEYLLKLQMIVSNTTFKNREESDTYETLETRFAGEAYVKAVTKQDHYNDYEYDKKILYSTLEKEGYSSEQILFMLDNQTHIPANIRNLMLEQSRINRVNTYVEENPYYVMLTGNPFPGNDKMLPQREVPIPEGFYHQYKHEGELSKDQPIHTLPSKYKELLINSKYYEPLLEQNRDCQYLRYIGSNAIPIHISRPAKDGDILKINADKLHMYHDIFGYVDVSPDIVHQFVETYHKVRKYVYGTLRGEFSAIYENYNSFIRFLTIYLTIGNALNEFMKKSSNMIYMNNVTCHDFFMLYGLPSVIMENNNMMTFLKKFRLFLMDKGTNVVYKIKDIIGYEYTDIYTLIMVKQQAFINGIPVYYRDQDGSLKPKQEIVFRRTPTIDEASSYFEFRDETREFTLDEITSGDPRWWDTDEVRQMIQDMNYTLSNSKYIQLSTHMSSEDIWWQTTILLRGLLDKKSQTRYTQLVVDYNIPGTESINVYDGVLTLINLMNWLHIDFRGNHFRGDLPTPNEYAKQVGLSPFVDMLFNGLRRKNNYIIPNPLKVGGPYKLSAFNFDVNIEYPTFMNDLSKAFYINENNQLVTMLTKIFNQTNPNVGNMLMDDVYAVYQYMESKLLQCTRIEQFRETTDVYSKLFLIDPAHQWDRMEKMDTLDMICESDHIDDKAMELFKTQSLQIQEDEYIIIDEHHRLSPYDILNKNVWDIVIDGEHVFRDDTKRSNILEGLKQWTSSTIEQWGIPGISTNKMYRIIIQQKIIIDCESTDGAPNTFEALLRRDNPIMYSLLNTIRGDHNAIVTLSRAIINALETYTNSSLSALGFSVLGANEYIRILKEVISYFKSYMVEYTKDELSLVFDGLYDRGGNSNMLQLYDDMAHMQFRLIIKDSLSLYDVSHMDALIPQPDDNTNFMYDDAIFRIRTTYRNLLNTGYDIWYDTGTELTKEPFEIGMNDKVLANMIPDGAAYKIIIPFENVGDSKIPPNYVGNVY
jgi:hypothetical protein